MSQQMDTILEKFYLSVLDYAGMEMKDGTMVNKSDKIGAMKVDGKHLTLPYHDNLRNPNGRHIFHPLNESYTTPETSFLGMYKKRLVLELNMKLSALMISLLSVCGDVSLQQKAKNPKLVALLSSIGETDPATTENFVSMVKHSQKVNEEAFLFDIFVKKNGQIGDVPFAAIGKVNFLAYTELHRALEDKGDGYKVYGGKMRKKDICSIINVFDALFNLPDATEDTYTVGTDHKPFRYFNAILLATYQVANRVNEVAKLLATLKEPLLGADDMFSDLEWSTVIEDVYGLTEVIRMIPNQSNASAEVSKLKVREPKVTESVPVPDMSRQPPQATQPTFTPQVQQPQQQNLPQSAPTAEDIIRGAVNQQRQMMQPQMMTPQQALMMQQYQQFNQPQQPMYQQPQQQWYNQQQQPQQPMYQQSQQPMYQQPMMMPQQQYTQPMYQQQPMQQPQQQNPFNQGQQPPQQGIMLNPFLV